MNDSISEQFQQLLDDHDLLIRQTELDQVRIELALRRMRLLLRSIDNLQKIRAELENDIDPQ